MLYGHSADFSLQITCRPDNTGFLRQLLREVYRMTMPFRNFWTVTMFRTRNEVDQATQNFPRVHRSSVISQNVPDNTVLQFCKLF